MHEAAHFTVDKGRTLQSGDVLPLGPACFGHLGNMCPHDPPSVPIPSSRHLIGSWGQLVLLPCILSLELETVEELREVGTGT